MKKDTRLTRAGTDPHNNHGIINPPVYHASTISAPTLAGYAKISAERYQEGTFAYGLDGTPTQLAFERAIADLEGGDRCVALPSGLAAIAVAVLAFVKSGDHLLIVDSAYTPARLLADSVLADNNVQVTYYDPMLGKDIAQLMQPNTKVVFAESPGSQTFEVQDIPAIVDVAHSRGAVVVMDNTWSGGYYYRPLEHGVDVSLQAATKYIGGHSDLMLGTIVVKAALYEQMKSTAKVYGYHAAPDDCYQALRGLRTMGVRLERHQSSALALARWLETRPEVNRVLHPALEACPGHEHWRRDFEGSSGLFSFLLNDQFDDSAVTNMIDGLALFAIGASWGGYESLVMRLHPEDSRTATPWSHQGALVRLHIGLEDVDDLRDDLTAGFERLTS